uniref:Uncharacterized protein n=1 Tax=Anguilla anguilla TaxID=7936 RepID=A0A0E9PEE6_ANGAN
MRMKTSELSAAGGSRCR